MAVPVGSLMIAVLLNGPWWTTHPLTAPFQSVLYGLAGTMVYGWLVLPLTVPSAVVGAFLLQRLLARLGAWRTGLGHLTCRGTCVVECPCAR